MNALSHELKQQRKSLSYLKPDSTCIKYDNMSVILTASKDLND